MITAFNFAPLREILRTKKPAPGTRDGPNLFNRFYYLPHEDGLHGLLQSFLSLQAEALHSVAVLAFAAFLVLSDAKAELPDINVRASMPMSIFFMLK
jgi:hypothetical protein